MIKKKSNNEVKWKKTKSPSHATENADAANWNRNLKRNKNHSGKLLHYNITRIKIN